VSELDGVVAEIVDEMHRRTDRGEVATYIPDLAAVDPSQFGLAVITSDGHVCLARSSQEAVRPLQRDGALVRRLFQFEKKRPTYIARLFWPWMVLHKD
jgi:hypothetical protein